METDIIKEIANAGMGLGSLFIMGILFIYQLKTNSRMFDKFGENIDKNTDATMEMTKTLIVINETNKDMINSVAYCKNKK